MFRIKIAEHVFEVNNRYADIESLCREYITAEQSQFFIEVTEAEIQNENTESQGVSMGYLETLAVYRKICDILRERKVFLFHCSALAMDGKAYLFTAPSGTGKSTHARLWKKKFGDRVIMINDDKPLLRAEKDGITVFGTPWAGKDRLQTNVSAPVCGIVILHQAKENSIRRIDAKEAFPMLLNQTHRAKDPEGMKYTLDFVGQLTSLPVYALGCTMSEEAVMLAYKALVE